jgi:hypothetical protein
MASLKRRVGESAAKLLGFVRGLTPDARRVAALRAQAESKFVELSRNRPLLFDGKTLVDGTFDNANFWYRYALMRAGLGLANGREVGLIGPYNRRRVRRTFSNLGIGEVRDLASPSGIAAQARKITAGLLAQAKSADDVVCWELPGGVDPTIVYDSILKRQRLAFVDPARADFPELVYEAILRILRVIEVLDKEKPDLVVVSHTVGLVCGPLAYLAAKRGIPVLLAFGFYGALRFTRIETVADIFSFYDRPVSSEIDMLHADKADEMAQIGRTYLARRFDGKANDLASLYAFGGDRPKTDRAAICRAMGWRDDRPIVAVYAANWFDWPHQLGMTQFRDFHDWIRTTFDAASKVRDVNWLFKPHPAEDWFGGIELRAVMAEFGSATNVGVSDKAWNNTDVMAAIDAIVTYHGTAGIEFSALGKPVLVPDKGKYDDCGFVRVASSRADYLKLLAQAWWREFDPNVARRRAEIFAGWWFCVPEWQGKFLTLDDSLGAANYSHILPLLDQHPAQIGRELATLEAWWKSRHRYYHTWKMEKADAYQLSNV